MANSVTALFDEKWSRRIQIGKKAHSVAFSVSNFEEQANLSSGDTVHRPKSIDFYVRDYSRIADNAHQDIVANDETMTIDQEKMVSFYIDELDERQSKYNIENESLDRAIYRLADDIDKARFKETLNADYSADGTQIGDSAGAISVNSSNFIKLFPFMKAFMANKRIEADREWYSVLSPEVIAAISVNAISNGFQKADATMEAGYKGNFGGFRIYESTNLTHEYKLLAANLGNAKNVVINGVTLTGITTAVAADQYQTAADLILLINGGASVQSLSQTAKDKLGEVKAVAIASGSDVIIRTSGATSMTANAVAPANPFVYNEFGRMGAVDLVTQLRPKMQKNKESQRSGYTYLCFDLYGLKTFEEGKARMVKVPTLSILQ